MNSFDIINETNITIDELDTIKKLLEFATEYLNINKCIFNVIIVDEDKIKYLNKNYRNKDSITDVISFALEDDETFIKTDFRVLGDIYICYKKALDQSIEYNHSLLRELSAIYQPQSGSLEITGGDIR